MRPMTHPLSRRAFLLKSLAGALGISALSITEELLAAVDERLMGLDGFRLPTVSLGETGIRPSLLAFGTGTNGSNYSSAQTRLGFDALVNLLEYAYDRGVTFFDLAQQYGSHPHMGRALVSGGGTIPRDKVVLLTKINLDYNFSGPPYDVPLKDPVVYTEEVLDTLRSQTGTDYFDIVLLHHMGAYSATGDWVRRYEDVMEMLTRQQAEGRIGALGASLHSDDNRYGHVSPLQLAADTDWVKVALVRLNPWDGVVGGQGRTMDGTRAQVIPILEQLKARGAGLIGMKVFNLGGTVDNSPFDGPKKAEAMTSAVGSPLLDCFTLGHLSREQLDENLALISALVDPPQPLPAETWSVF